MIEEGACSLCFGPLSPETLGAPGEICASVRYPVLRKVVAGLKTPHHSAPYHPYAGNPHHGKDPRLCPASGLRESVRSPGQGIMPSQVSLPVVLPAERPHPGQYQGCGCTGYEMDA